MQTVLLYHTLGGFLLSYGRYEYSALYIVDNRNARERGFISIPFTLRIYAVLRGLIWFIRLQTYVECDIIHIVLRTKDTILEVANQSLVLERLLKQSLSPDQYKIFLAQKQDSQHIHSGWLSWAGGNLLNEANWKPTNCGEWMGCLGTILYLLLHIWRDGPGALIGMEWVRLFLWGGEVQGALLTDSPIPVSSKLVTSTVHISEYDMVGLNCYKSLVVN